MDGQMDQYDRIPTDERGGHRYRTLMYDVFSATSINKLNVLQQNSSKSSS